MAQTRNPAALDARTGLELSVCAAAIDSSKNSSKIATPQANRWCRKNIRQHGNTHAGRVDFAAVNRAALSDFASILERLLPGGADDGSEYTVCNPTRDDRCAGSFKINLETGRWADFAISVGGGDPVSLVAYLDGTSQVGAARRLARMLGINCDGSRPGLRGAR